MLVNAEGLLLLREPKNHYGGYVWTYAKGGPDAGETPEEAALREVREECGWDAKIVAEIDTWFGGTTSATYFWLMRPVQDLGSFDKETAQIRWISFDRAPMLIKQTSTSRGRKRDLAVLRAARQVFEANR